ncbi:flagellar brake protein [Alkaliphilus crotonatoxidans]
MDIAAELKIGDKLEIQITSEDQEVSPIVSQVVDLKENRIFIVNPMKQGSVYALRKGQRIKVIFYRGEKGIFRFTAEIKGKLEKNLTIYEIVPVEEAEKIQRRYFYRFEVVKRVLIKERSASEEYTAVTKDISGGGMKLYCKKSFKLGTVVSCRVFLDEEEETFVSGEVVRSEFDPEVREYILGINFTDIRESTRNRIVSFIFEKQRLLRKKGLI